MSTALSKQLALFGSVPHISHGRLVSVQLRHDSRDVRVGEGNLLAQVFALEV